MDADRGGSSRNRKRDEVLEQVCRQGGFVYAAHVATACGNTVCGNHNRDYDDGCRQWAAEVAQEMAWEQLHAGPWHSVHPAWRDAYSLSCLLVSSSLRRAGRPQDALKVLDMGLLLGGPFLKADLDNAICAFSSSACRQEDSGRQCSLASSTSPLCPLPSYTDHDTSAIMKHASSAYDPQVMPKLPPGSFHSSTVLRRALLSVEDFLCDFFAPGTPVIIQSTITHWPALRKWKDLNYLGEAYGERTIPVEVGEHYLAPGWKQELMTMLDFLKQMKSSECSPFTRVYLAQHPLFDQIPKLQEDIVIPDYCAATGGELQSINAWIGPMGTITPAHQDPHHNLLAQVVGQKYVRLYSPDSSTGLYPFSESMLHNSSQVDMDAPDHTKFPLAEKLPFWDCILNEGEMLYIPPKWWHYVKSLNLSFSVSFWWSVDDEQ